MKEENLRALEFHIGKPGVNLTGVGLHVGHQGVLGDADQGDELLGGHDVRINYFLDQLGNLIMG